MVEYGLALALSECGPVDPEGRARGGREHTCVAAAVDRLTQMSGQGGLSSEHVRLTAEALGVAERTMWRWLSARRLNVAPTQRDRFRIDDRLRVRLVSGEAMPLRCIGSWSSSTERVDHRRTPGIDQPRPPITPLKSVHGRG
ncbi:hypothetical protein B0T36_06075 [Nocardia donostiensis]|nr:hypothetical protein B0T36_06075 [Nocardia donostiensis]